MYIAIIRCKDAALAERHMEAHCDYLAAYMSIGNFVVAGPLAGDAASGVIIFNADSAGEVDDIMRRDPLRVHGAADYEILEFSPTMVCDETLRKYF